MPRPARRAAGDARSTKPPVAATNADMSPPYALHPLADADQPVPEAVAAGRARRGRRRAPRAAARTACSRRSRRRGRPGVLEGVGEALLHDAVRREVERRAAGRPGRRARAAVRRARPRARRRQRLQVVQPGLRVSARAGRPPPQGAEQPPHLGERRTAGCSTFRSASPSSDPAGSRCRTAPTWSTITLIAWATTSWSSRAIRARSSATATRAADSRSRSALPRPLLGRLGLLGPRRAARSPTSQPTRRASGVKTRSPAGAGRVVGDDRGRADQRRRISPTRACGRRAAPQQHGRAHPGRRTPRAGGDQLTVDEAHSARCRSRRTPAPRTATACRAQQQRAATRR